MKRPVRLLAQPDIEIRKMIQGINNAKESIKFVVFRGDQDEIERVLRNAVNGTIDRQKAGKPRQSGVESH